MQKYPLENPLKFYLNSALQIAGKTARRDLINFCKMKRIRFERKCKIKSTCHSRRRWASNKRAKLEAQKRLFRKESENNHSSTQNVYMHPQSTLERTRYFRAKDLISDFRVYFRFSRARGLAAPGTAKHKAFRGGAAGERKTLN